MLGSRFLPLSKKGDVGYEMWDVRKNQESGDRSQESGENKDLFKFYLLNSGYWLLTIGLYPIESKGGRK